MCPISVFGQVKKDKLLFGVAYYDEYMPYNRLEKDVQIITNIFLKKVL
jgi:beta-galactosidase